MAIFIGHTTLFIEDYRSVVDRVIDVAQFLLYLFVIIRHLLIDDEAWVQVVSHELFNPSELKMLVHQLRHRDLFIEHTVLILLKSITKVVAVTFATS